MQNLAFFYFLEILQIEFSMLNHIKKRPFRNEIKAARKQRLLKSNMAAVSME